MMRRSSRVLLLFLLSFPALATSAGAGFRIPRYVYRVDQFAQAQAEAARTGRPLAVLCSNERSRCGLCSDASMAMIREFRARAVIVYATHTELQTMPLIVRRSINSRAAGIYIPKMAFFDSSLGRTLALVPFRWRDGDRIASFRLAGRQLGSM